MLQRSPLAAPFHSYYALHFFARCCAKSRGRASERWIFAFFPKLTLHIITKNKEPRHNNGNAERELRHWYRRVYHIEYYSVRELQLRTRLSLQS
jgi:hypothetical protein